MDDYMVRDKHAELTEAMADLAEQMREVAAEMMQTGEVPIVEKSRELAGASRMLDDWVVGIRAEL